MRKLLLFILILPALAGCNSSSKNEFVIVKGTQFYVNNNPYRFIGFNMWHACYLGASKDGQERLVKELDTLKAYGFDNLRILGGSEKSPFNRSLPEAFQSAPGSYNDSLLKGLDFVLAEMGKRKMYAVIYLNNYWQWSGGMAQYMNWSTGDSISDADGDFTRMMNYSARFYADSGANDLFRNYVRMLVNRRNLYSGLQYKNDPAIMAWELANEPRPGPDGPDGERNIEEFIRWNHNTCAWIHSIDSNHLVTTGSEGIVGCIQNENYFIRTLDDPSIDFATFHLWAKNWGWFDANRIDSTLPASISHAREYINRHIDLARKLGKPITMEEFGLDRDSGKTEPFTPVTARNHYFRAIMDLYTDSTLADAPLAGVNIWALGGYGQPLQWEKVMHNAGAFLGDPFGEPQGLNSVYFSDTSTMNILYRARKRLAPK
jgi:mannan endo-1,4-beta-mannosidase